MSRILDGIKVIDFTEGHMGSYGTMLLSDFGAEVIKIENAETGGDFMRSRAPKNEKGSAYHAYLNRGKKSVCVDRKTDEGRKIILELIAKADVVCDCFKEGELESCGLGYDDACKVKPDIIYASHTGFGKTGPMSNTTGSNLTVEAVTGLLDVTGHEGSIPTAHGSRIAEQFGNLFFAIGIIGALLVRNETGEGQVVDVASSDAMFTALEDILIDELMTGKIYIREGNASRSIAPYDTFKVKDGYVSTAVSTNAQWKKFCDVMGFPEYADDIRFNSNDNRGANYDDILFHIINDRFKDMTRDEIENMLRPLNIPSGPTLTVEEAIHSEQINCRNMVVELEDKALGKLKMPGINIKLSGEPDEPVSSAPLLGENTEEFLSIAGYSAEEIAGLQARGIIKTAGGEEQ